MPPKKKLTDFIKKADPPAKKIKQTEKEASSDALQYSMNKIFLLSLWLCRFRMQKLSEVFPWWIWSKTSHDPEFCKIFFETWCWLVDTRIFNSISSKSRIRSRELGLIIENFTLIFKTSKISVFSQMNGGNFSFENVDYLLWKILENFYIIWKLKKKTLSERLF